MNSETATPTWAEANRAYLDRQLQRLRLLLQRRVLWLRKHWRQDELQPLRGAVISETHADLLLNGEDLAAKRRFYEEDKDAAQLTQAISQLSSDSTHADGLSEHAPAMEILAQTFGLSPLERDVVVLCLAPKMDAAFEQLYAYLQDDGSRKSATQELAAALLSDDRLAVRECFLADGPLQRYRLITPSNDSGEIQLDDRIADYLCGFNRFDRRIATLLTPLKEALLAGEHDDVAKRVNSALTADNNSRCLPVINLVAAPGVGKQSVAVAIFRRLQLYPMTLDVLKLPTETEPLEETIRLLAREASLLQMGVYIDVVDWEDDQRVCLALNDLIQRLEAPVIVGSRRRHRSRRETIFAEVPKLSSQSQAQLWRHALGPVPADQLAIEEIVQQFDFGPEAIRNAFRDAWSGAPLADVECELILPRLWQACRQQGAWRLDTLAQRIEPCHSWRDIVLPDDVLAQLHEIVAQVPHRVTVYERWGFAQRNSRSRGITACFSGPSGCGKTMAADILAHQLQLDLYRIDLASVISKYIGETEKNLRKVFEAAEQSGAVLFFDEADALFGKRTEVKDSHDRYANIEINYLLQRMEDYRGLAILATNRKSDLDRAFLRRLRFLVDFPFPNAADRRRIWERVFPARAPLGDLDYDALSRWEIAGGNIRTISLNAAFLAAQNGTVIGMSELTSAARREYAKIDKLSGEADFGPTGRRGTQRHTSKAAGGLASPANNGRGLDRASPPAESSATENA